MEGLFICLWVKQSIIVWSNGKIMHNPCSELAMLQAAVPAVLTSPQLEGIVLGTAAAPVSAGPAPGPVWDGAVQMGSTHNPKQQGTMELDFVPASHFALGVLAPEAVEQFRNHTIFKDY